MGLNSNNYVGTELDWTPYTNDNDLPLGKQLVFKCENGDLMYGSTVAPASGGQLLIVDGKFGFDCQGVLLDSQWTVIDFIFEEEFYSRRSSSS